MKKHNVLSIVVIFALALSNEGVQSERWSRQVSKSEWIPLAAPRTTQSEVQSQGQELESEGKNGLVTAADQTLPQVQPLSLPPELQQQYQEQLLQLQKTQESIEKLLLLQQQLKNQQRLLKSDPYTPGHFANSNSEKIKAQSTSEDLVPPAPSSEALPPIYAAQTFRNKNPSEGSDYRKSADESTESYIPESQPFVSRLKHSNVKHGNNYHIVNQREQAVNNERNYFPTTQNNQDSGENEEVQLVYVPAETLSQRGQLKLHTNRVRQPNQQLHYRPQQYNNEGHSSARTSSPNQDGFSQTYQQQLQREQEDRSEFVREERLKEIARLAQERKEIEKQAKLHEAAVLREQDLKRQRDEEKQKKELEELEELAKQRELQRLRQLREKQKTEIEKRKQAELKLKEEKRKKEEAEKLERQKSYNLELNEKPRASSLIRDNNKQLNRHQSDSTKPTVNNRVRQRFRPKTHSQQKNIPNYSEQDEILVPQPNQPPLAIYMENFNSETRKVRVTDALRLLKNAKTIAVLDTVEQNSPKVFVGPSSLDPPPRYVKFNLPYLSSIENSRLEKTVEKLPFFVAPLSFDPPPGYSKILFPAPHIGSVVVNTLSLDTQIENTQQEQNERTHNIYYDDDDKSFERSQEEETTVIYLSSEQTTPKYQTVSNLKSHSRPRERLHRVNEDKTRVHNLENKRSSTASYNEEQTTERIKPLKTRQYQSTLSPTYNSRISSSLNYPSNIPETTPNDYERILSHSEPIKQQSFEKHTTSNQDIRQNVHYRIPEQQRHHYTIIPSNHQSNLDYRDLPKYDDSTSSIGSTQYSLPAELPAISPHLPGLVNALIEKNEATTTTTTEATTTTTTTTTTEAPPTVKSRTRGRQRGRVSVRPTSTNSPTRISNEKSRRPYTRSRTKINTTTEGYRESSYEPTRAKYDETTVKYEPEVRRRNPYRVQKQKDQETESKISELINQNQNTESRVIYEPIPTIGTLTLNKNYNSISTTKIPSQLNVEYTDTIRDSVENYPRGIVTSKDSIEYPKKTYVQNRHHSQQETQHEPKDDTPTYNSQLKLDEAPINGFNYHAQPGGNPTETLQDQNFHVTETEKDDQYERLRNAESPYLEKNKEQDFVSLYSQSPANYEEDNPRPTYYHNVPENQSPDSTFLNVHQHDEKDYVNPTSGTFQEIITRSRITTTTNEPVTIRQKVRTRLGSQVQSDSAVQTKPHGSQDEYVRFSAVNQDSDRTSSRQRNDYPRRRQKVRPQNVYKTEVQTEGEEYVRIQTPQSYRHSTSTASSLPEEVEVVNYGFTRTPNFKPVPTEENYSSSTFRQIPVSYVQADETDNQRQISKTQEYNVPNRKIEIKIPVTPATVAKYNYPVSVEDDVSNTKSSEIVNSRPNIRGRARRPGARRRPTSNTQTGLDVNNELPIEENYPRIIQTIQRPLVNPRPTAYENSYEQPEPLVIVRNASFVYPDQVQDVQQPQDYILHYSPVSGSNERYNSYEQNPDDDVSPQTSNVKYSTHSLKSSDIYGAESQWSAKISQDIFNRNNFPEEVTKNIKNAENNEKNIQTTTNLLETITRQPEDVITETTHLQNLENTKKPEFSPEEFIMEFGKKMNNNNEIVANTKKPNIHEQNINSNNEITVSSVDNRTQNRTNKRKGQKKRVRVRVRPLDNNSMESKNDENYSKNLVTSQTRIYAHNLHTTLKSSTASEIFTTPKSSLEDFFGVMANNENSETLTTSYPIGQQEYHQEIPTTVDSISETFIPYEMSTVQNDVKSDIVTDQTTTDHSNQSNATTSNDYPNHRLTFSEVEYQTDKNIPDFSMYYTKNYKNKTTELNDQDSSEMNKPQSLSDYVKVIFDSIKNVQQAETLDVVTTNDSSDFKKQEPIQQIPLQTSSEKLNTTTQMNIDRRESTEDHSQVNLDSLRTNKNSNVLRTSTTTKVSHMTEICYRGKCVMTKPKMNDSER